MTRRAILCFVPWCLPLLGQSAQTLLIPQVVDGGGWQTTFALTNTTTNPASVSLSFRSDTTAGATQAWTPPFLEVGSTTGLVVSGGSTTYLHTPGTAANLSQGFATVNADAGIVAYVIFTFRASGHPDQDGTALAAASTARILVPFDNSSGLVTSVGVVNPTGVSQTISVNFSTSSGTVSQGSLSNIPPNGHAAFTLPQQFPSIAGQKGLAEFYSTSGTFSLLALRFNPTQAFTAAPVYFENGPPIISAGGPPSPVTFGPGQYLIGSGIPAGRYFAAPTSGCYWERLSGLGGTAAEIIANDFVDASSMQTIVDIQASDLAFSAAAACGTWFSTPRSSFQAVIPAGTWLVGIQIAPGTYQTNAASGCYWERVVNFSGSSTAVVANNFVLASGPQMVAISAGDTGFTTNSSCGTWTQVSSQSAISSSAQTPAEVKRHWIMKRSKDTLLQTPFSDGQR